MIIESIEHAHRLLNQTDRLSLDQSFAMAGFCSRNLRSQKTECHARDLAIRVLHDWNKIPGSTGRMWNDVVEACGLIPYTDAKLLGGASRLRYEFHKSNYLKGVYFHEEQNSVSLRLGRGQSVILTAPTSFGKSLLIEEVVASRKYSNIVIIQPTLALIDETRKRLSHYHDTYRLIVSTGQSPIRGAKHIFLFTAERVVDYSLFPAIDFFVIDEFYKLSMNREDERAVALNQAFYRLRKYTEQYYLLGPSVGNLSEQLPQTLKDQWVKSDFATVALDDKRVPGSERRRYDKEATLFQFLATENDPTLIYCATPDKATQLALAFSLYMVESRTAVEDVPQEIGDICEWVEENIHADWSLSAALRRGVAFHHGGLPRHLGSTIVDLFNARHIRYLFCTSTLIEGVNTSARNVVLFDHHKGRKPIDYFDYRNIAGRSGRMRKYFVGRVFRFEDAPNERNIQIDIPVITQDNAPLELLIQLDADEIRPEARDRLASFYALSDDLKALLRKNSGVPVEGQLAVIKEIQGDLPKYNALLAWKSFPTFQELLAVTDLAWRFLLKPTESKANIRSARHLAFMALRYSSIRSLRGVIDASVTDQFWIDRIPEFQLRVDRVTSQVLSIARHWFDYRLPRLLATISNLQEYVFVNNSLPSGDYLFLAAQLENSFVPAHLAVLLEYDIPASALRKLAKFIDPNVAANQMLVTLSRYALRQSGLGRYELSKIRSAMRQS